MTGTLYSQILCSANRVFVKVMQLSGQGANMTSEAIVPVPIAGLVGKSEPGHSRESVSFLNGLIVLRRHTLSFKSRVATAFLVMSCGASVCSQLALSEGSWGGKKKIEFYIAVQDGRGSLVAGPVVRPAKSKSSSAELVFIRDYQPGDRILFRGPQWMAVRVDDTMPECLIYAPGASSENLSYEIPYGRAEQQTGSAYAPESFAGGSHRVRLRILTKHERSGYRNLALNPCDLQRSERQPVRFFPHASSNSVSRSLFDFEARNAIDGYSLNGHHGVWPYQSWGPQLRTDIWWRLDFGRLFELDKVRLMVRADFPHDSYWKSAEIEFSDGSRLPCGSLNPQHFRSFHSRSGGSHGCASQTSCLKIRVNGAALLRWRPWGKICHSSLCHPLATAKIFSKGPGRLHLR
jgi:hypothetical protein